MKSPKLPVKSIHTDKNCRRQTGSPKENPRLTPELPGREAQTTPAGTPRTSDAQQEDQERGKRASGRWMVIS